MVGTTERVAILVAALVLIGLVLAVTARRRRRGEKPWKVSNVLVVVAMVLTAAVQISHLV